MTTPPSPRSLQGRRAFCASLALCFVAVGCRKKQAAAPAADPNASTFRPGQKFAYRTRPGEEGSTLTVIRVEAAQTLGVIIHITIEGLKMKSPRSPSGMAETIGHMPFSEAALHRSVTALIGNAPPSAAAEAGYAEWRRAYESGKAGIYTIPVAEAADTVARSLTN